MSTNILFLTEAGEGIGFGHLSRSIALADGFESLNCKISFTVRGTENAVIHNRAFTEVNKEWFDEEYIESAVPTYDITVVDSYRVSDEMLNYISEYSENPVFLIDSQLKYGNQGILLFPSVYAEEFTFDSSKHLKILTGIKYLLFTKEMWRELRFEVHENIEKIGLSLGSSALAADDGLSASRLRRVFPRLTQIFVFGNLHAEYWVDDERVNVDWLGRLNKEDYVEKLQNLDLLISNGGQTLNEALLIGLPVLPLITADNQLKNVNGWEKKNLVNGVDLRNRLDPDGLYHRLKTLGEYNSRKEFYEKCRHTIDSKGPIRAAKEILKLRTN